MVTELMSAYGGRLLIALLGVGIGFLCLIGVLWLLRGRRGPSPFIRGGRNRQPRLQVLDAAAVDARRRLVLVRRDEVEHLIMIGGPTDIVIESGIAGAKAADAQPAPGSVVATRAQMPTPPHAESSTPPARPIAPPEDRRDPVKQPQAAAPAQASPPEPAAPQPRTASAERKVAAPASSFAPATPPAAAPFLGPLATPPQIEPAAVRREPVVDDAAEILDAARTRVFQGPTEPVRPAPATVALDAPKRPLGSEFERILEEEMATNLAARETVEAPGLREAEQRQPNPAPVDPARPRVTGATPEPSLQDEMARIFGEMSVTRDR